MVWQFFSQEGDIELGPLRSSTRLMTDILCASRHVRFGPNSAVQLRQAQSRNLPFVNSALSGSSPPPKKVKILLDAD